MLFLVLSSVLLVVTDCAGINKVQQKTSYDDYGKWGRTSPKKLDNRDGWWRGTTQSWNDHTDYQLDDDFLARSPSFDSALALVIFLPVVFLIVIVLGCLLCQFCLWKSCGPSSSSPPTVVHPPPTISVLLPSHGAEIGRLQLSTDAAFLHHGAEVSDSSHPFFFSGAYDKPPLYADVVLGDFASVSAKYPKAADPETPPPEYQCESFME